MTGEICGGHEYMPTGLFNIAAAVLLRGGLLYSVLLSYGGLLAGAAHAKLPKAASRPQSPAP